MADVAMPRLSDSMEVGTILKWLKSDGDEVKRGEELVEIETDKANMTYEADAAGALKIVAQEGDTLAVGETIAQIGGGGGAEPAESSGDAGADEEQDGGADAPEDEVERVKQPDPVATEEQDEPEPRPEREQENGRVKASPVARRMAKERGVELSTLAGSGPGGRIVKSDVEAAATNGAQQPAEEPEATDSKEAAAPRSAVTGDKDSGRGETTTEDLSRLQQTIARRMAESKATAPEFVVTCEVDMHAAVEFREQLKAAAGDAPAPSFNDLVVKASALALTEFPRANGAYRDGSSSSTRVSTWASRLQARMRWSCRRSSTPTASRSARSRVTHARSPSACEKVRSRRRSCRRGPSPSRTSACSASSASPR
jgi:pyruvate dehydrogenase E2 component (dihydrolipoamide acetyltransferase)